jgi:hypothetical protein
LIQAKIINQSIKNKVTFIQDLVYIMKYAQCLEKILKQKAGCF